MEFHVASLETMSVERTCTSCMLNLSSLVYCVMEGCGVEPGNEARSYVVTFLPSSPTD